MIIRSIFGLLVTIWVWNNVNPLSGVVVGFLFVGGLGWKWVSLPLILLRPSVRKSLQAEALEAEALEAERRALNADGKPGRPDVHVRVRYTPGLILACVLGGWALVGLLIALGLVELRYGPTERLNAYVDAVAYAADWSSDRIGRWSGRITPVEAHIAAAISLLVAATFKTQIDVNSQVRIALGMPKSRPRSRFWDRLFMIWLGVYAIGWLIGALLPLGASIPVFAYFGFKQFDRSITTFDTAAHDELLVRSVFRMTIPGIALAAVTIVIADRLIGLLVS